MPAAPVMGRRGRAAGEGETSAQRRLAARSPSPPRAALDSKPPGMEPAYPHPGCLWARRPAPGGALRERGNGRMGRPTESGAEQ